MADEKPIEPAAPAATPAPAAVTPPAPAAAAAPAADAAPAGVAAVVEAPAAAAPAAEPAPAADAKPAVEPAKEFAPSLLDEAAKPTADAKPGEAAPATDAAKPADAKPSDTKEPAAKDGKAQDAKPAEPPAPIEYKFKLPEGVKPEDVLNTERMTAFNGILNEARVPPEVAQKFLDLHLDATKQLSAQIEDRISKRQWEVFEQTQKQWREQTLADPELGGSRHATAIGTVMDLLNAYTQRDQKGQNPRSADVIAAERKGLLDVFRMTGVANNPEFLRFAHWAGDVITKEGKPRPAPVPRQQTPTGQNRGLRRYQGSTPAQANGAG